MKVANRCLLIAGTLAAALSISAFEVAAQQQPLLGCVKPSTGLLRILSGNDVCKAEETPLGFNDLPLLVALRTQVEQLQAAVVDLQQRLEEVEACTGSIPECHSEP
jgi:hypothetical protein